MPVTRDIRCSDCAHVFSWLFMNDDDAPKHCPNCGVSFDGERPPTSLISAPAIREKAITKSIDGSYRAMEEGAAHRAAVAKEMGADDDAANSLKITDMKSNLQYGEIAAKEVSNPVSQHMDMINSRTPGAVGFQARESGLSLASGAHTGPFDHAGARAQQSLRNMHAQFTASAGHKGATTSSIPALETTQPGYRRRV